MRETTSRRLQPWTAKHSIFGVLLWIATGATCVQAQEPAPADDFTKPRFEVTTPGPLGSERLPIDGYTQVTGWELGAGWYFGNYKGDQRGVGLLWQDTHDQFSLTTKGVRFVHRF